MRKLKLQMQMSIVRYVAGPNGELEWITFSLDERASARLNELTDTSDTILLVRKMTDGFVDCWTCVLGNPESPQYSFTRKMVDIAKVVFSKTVKESKWANTNLANGELTEEVDNLKNRCGKDILVYGGADFVSSLIQNNLIDEYHLFINPVAIGKGMSVFGDSYEKLNLRFIKSETFSNGKVDLCCEPQKNLKETF